MRILQVTPRYPPRTGGVEEHVRSISERLVGRGHTVTVYSADAGSGVPREERRNGVQVRRFRGVAPGGAYHFAPGIYTAVRAANVDVVHGHNYHSFPLLLAGTASNSRPFVATPHYHGTGSSGLRDRLLRLYRPIGRRGLSRAERVLGVSRWECDRLRRDLGIEATHVPNGIEVERFRDVQKGSETGDTILTVGRLESYKGIQFVIQALESLPEVSLSIVGSGPYRETLASIAAEHAVEERVVFHGYVDDEELAQLYADATVFVNLSEIEAFGMTVGEALAAGTPCVVYNARALAEWAERGDCIGISARDPETVAGAIRDASTLEAPTEPLPTWDSVVDQLESIYEELTGVESS